MHVSIDAIIPEGLAVDDETVEEVELLAFGFFTDIVTCIFIALPSFIFPQILPHEGFCLVFVHFVISNAHACRKALSSISLPNQIICIDCSLAHKLLVFRSWITKFR